jgi:hypothetical protein
VLSHKKRSLDLHWMTISEAKKAFVDFYNGAISGSGGRTIRLEIIHGYGSTGVGGVLRRWFRGFLDRHLSYLEYQRGESVDGNQGYTFVTPLKPLPVQAEELGEEILAYCAIPRAQSKIIGKFRRYGDAEVLSAIKLLERQKGLTSSAHGMVKLYQAI